MDDRGQKMYKTRMSDDAFPPDDLAAGQRHLGPEDRIHFHTPGRFADVWPYHVLVAGETHFPHARPAITYRFHAHTLIYTVAGRGDVALGGHHFTATPGSVVWLDTATRYAHRCHHDETLWSYLWVSVSGQGLDALFSHLQAAQNPVFLPADPPPQASDMRAVFTAAVANLGRSEGVSDAASSAHVAAILAGLSNGRGADAQDSSVGGRLQQVMDEMRADPTRVWRIEELAAIAALSPSQLFRQFRRKTAATPLDWLRHERMTLAKRGLVESRDPVWQVALRCGYPDPYHFSRDFRRITGQSPSQFRKANAPLDRRPLANV